MLGKITTPKTKSELLKSIQTLKNPNITVIEVLNKAYRKDVIQHVDKVLSRGQFSIIFIKE